MRSFSHEERRVRLGARHRLARPAPAIGEAVDDVVALHSSDPATVYLSARARVEDFEIADLERALYEERSLVRILGMRRTMFVVNRSLASIVHHSSTASYVRNEYRRLANLLESKGIATDGAAWLEDVANRTFDALRVRGEGTAGELTEDVPELGEKFEVRRKDGTLLGTYGMSTRVLFFLATDGRILRARPKGSWLSSQYRWAPLEDWLGEPLAEVEPEAARATLLEKWLRSFGPATETDLKWWTGWTLGNVRKALARIDAVDTEIEGSPAWVLGDDLEPAEPVGPWVALLPALDPTVMGWKERDWYLGHHAPALFDRNGNAGPTIWADGRVVGGWVQGPTGKVMYRLLEDVGAEASEEIEREAAACQTWLGETVVTPRFRTPLERELV